MLKVGERFGVSSSYMARVCTELRVPRPERGYWAKLEFGKVTTRPGLPSAQPGDVTQWIPGVSIGTTQRTAERKRVARPATLHRKSASSDQRHDLLTGVKAHFLKTRENDTGFLRPFKRLLVDIVVSEKHLDVTLEAADSLFTALSKRGHRVVLASPESRTRREEVDQREVPRQNHYHRSAWSPDRSTLVYVEGVAIGLTLFEMSESVEMMYVGSSKYVPVRDLTVEQLRRYREPNYWRTTKDLPSGRLALQAYSTSWRVKWAKRWQESTTERFASMVLKVIAELEAIAPELARKKEEAERLAEEERLKRLEEQRLAAEEGARLRRVKAAQDARQDILAAIASWEQVRSVHAYFDSVAREIDLLPEDERSLVRERLKEARALIGEVDALAQLKRWKAPQER